MHPTTTSRPGHPRGRHASVWLLLAMAMVVGACGTPASGPATATTDATTTTTTVVDDVPGRIVSLSATATEVLFAIGAGDRVVAVDDRSDHPAGAPTTDLSGFTPNVESIAAFDPDLVVAQDDPGGLTAAFDALGIELVLQPPPDTIEAAWEQMLTLGQAVGASAAAEALVDDLRSEAAEIVASAPDLGATYYHELDPTYYTVTGDTFVGDVYRQFGLTSVADGADSPYPQLSPETIISADPDLILLADGGCCDQSPETVAARPGWGGMQAVTSRAIVVLDEDIASRWGPRVIEFMRAVAEQLRTLAGA